MLLKFCQNSLKNNRYVAYIMQFTQTLWLHALSTRKNWIAHINWMNGNKYEYTTNARFTQGLLELIFTSTTSFLIEESFWNLSSLSKFSVFKKTRNNYFFRWLAKSLSLADLQCLWNYTVWSSSLFSAFSCFPRYS